MFQLVFFYVYCKLIKILCITIPIFKNSVITGKEKKVIPVKGGKEKISGKNILPCNNVAECHQYLKNKAKIKKLPTRRFSKCSTEENKKKSSISIEILMEEMEKL
ncbi:unnamed protein product [Meganyctiphanes norvegica]|uniref:Uncharacterized protein n=1 Tax=Meganyctiphanes norvegica TaxID=48144 RepID=A0AAV2PXN8_MEGNR